MGQARPERPLSTHRTGLCADCIQPSDGSHPYVIALGRPHPDCRRAATTSLWAICAQRQPSPAAWVDPERNHWPAEFAGVEVCSTHRLTNHERDHLREEGEETA
jgi:hypothetical protein